MARRLTSFLGAGVRRAFSRRGLDAIQFIVGLALLGWLDDLLSRFIAWGQVLALLARMIGVPPSELAEPTGESGTDVGALILGLMLGLWLLGLHRGMRRVGLAYLSILTTFLLARLVVMALTLFGRTEGAFLLLDGVIMWLLVWLYFTLWYWQLDGGGPSWRARADGGRWEIAFPQLAEAYPGWTSWRPGLTEYLLLALSVSLTFSTSDGSVMLSRRMKWLLMTHMLTAAAALIAVAGRALNLAG